jgi:hypothetical protein
MYYLLMLALRQHECQYLFFENLLTPVKKGLCHKVIPAPKRESHPRWSGPFHEAFSHPPPLH